MPASDPSLAGAAVCATEARRALRGLTACALCRRAAEALISKFEVDGKVSPRLFPAAAAPCDSAALSAGSRAHRCSIHRQLAQQGGATAAASGGGSDHSAVQAAADTWATLPHYARRKALCWQKPVLRSALTAHFRSLGTCKGCQGHIITRLDDVVSRDIVPEQTAASVRLARFMGNSTEPGACCSHARIHVRIVDEDLRPLIDAGALALAEAEVGLERHATCTAEIDRIIFGFAAIFFCRCVRDAAHEQQELTTARELVAQALACVLTDQARAAASSEGCNDDQLLSEFQDRELIARPAASPAPRKTKTKTRKRRATSSGWNKSAGDPAALSPACEREPDAGADAADGDEPSGERCRHSPAGCPGSAARGSARHNNSNTNNTSRPRQFTTCNPRHPSNRDADGEAGLARAPSPAAADAEDFDLDLDLDLDLHIAAATLAKYPLFASWDPRHELRLLHAMGWTGGW